MIGDNWKAAPPNSTSNDVMSYWRIDPNNHHMRWHVSYQQAHTFGTRAGEMIVVDGWYWYTANWEHVRFSSMVGPFSSAIPAMADCESAHKPGR